MKFSLFAKNALILTFSNTGLQILGFFYRMLLNHFAGSEGLGIYQLIFSIYIVVNTFCITGVVTAVTTLSAAFQSGLKSGSRRTLLQTAVFVFLCGYTIAFLLIVWKAQTLSNLILGNSEAIRALHMMLACIFLTGFENIFKAFFIGISKVKFAAISEVGEQSIRILAVFFLLYSFYQGNYGQLVLCIMTGMTISEIASVLFLSCSFHKTMKASQDDKKKKNKSILQEFLKISLPISMSSLINNLLNSMNSFLIPKMLIISGLTRKVAVSQLGIVSGAAMPILMLPVAIISAISTNIMPKISGTSSSKTAYITNRVMKTTGLIGIPATAAIIPLGTVAGRVLFGQEIPQKVFILLGISLMFLYYEMIMSSILNGLNLQKIILWGSLLSSVLQVILTVVLASRPSLKIYGYLYATLAASIFLFAFDAFWLSDSVRLSWKQAYTMPLLCGAVMYLWSRFFYHFIFSLLRRELNSLIFAVCATILLYSILLWILHVRLRSKYVVSKKKL